MNDNLRKLKQCLVTSATRSDIILTIEFWTTNTLLPHEHRLIVDEEHGLFAPGYDKSGWSLDWESMDYLEQNGIFDVTWLTNSIMLRMSGPTDPNEQKYIIKIYKLASIETILSK